MPSRVKGQRFSCGETGALKDKQSLWKGLPVRFCRRNVISASIFSMNFQNFEDVSEMNRILVLPLALHNLKVVTLGKQRARTVVKGD